MVVSHGKRESDQLGFQRILGRRLRVDGNGPGRLQCLHQFQKCGLIQHRPVVLFTGSPSPRKGLLQLIELELFKQPREFCGIGPRQPEVIRFEGQGCTHIYPDQIATQESLITKSDQVLLLFFLSELIDVLVQGIHVAVDLDQF